MYDTILGTKTVNDLLCRSCCS